MFITEMSWSILLRCCWPKHDRSSSSWWWEEEILSIPSSVLCRRQQKGLSRIHSIYWSIHLNLLFDRLFYLYLSCIDLKEDSDFTNIEHLYFLALMHFQTKWCPAPGCEYAVEFAAGSEGYDVCCTCSYNFCWNVSVD